MRDILFRGKRIRPDTDTNKTEWVYGYYMTVYGTPNIELKDGRECDVDPETVGQYTGLCDKNGTKIFEGDIVEVFYNPNYGGVAAMRIGLFKVVFDNGCFMKEKINNTGLNDTGLYHFIKSDVHEVKGNIHDNPELLEGGADE